MASASNPLKCEFSGVSILLSNISERVGKYAGMIVNSFLARTKEVNVSAHNTAEQNNNSGIDAADVLHVEGGKPLNGTIKVRGAKNFVSKAMVAALLAPGKSVLKNVPEIRDVHVVSDLLRLHGVSVDVNGPEGIVTIDATKVQLADVADVDTLSGSSRIPILFSGPLLIVLEKRLFQRLEAVILAVVQLISILKPCESLVQM